MQAGWVGADAKWGTPPISHPSNPKHPKHRQWLALSQDPELSQFVPAPLTVQAKPDSYYYQTLLGSAAKPLSPRARASAGKKARQESVSRLVPRSTTLNDPAKWNLLLPTKPDYEYQPHAQTSRPVHQTRGRKQKWMSQRVAIPARKRHPLEPVRLSNPSSVPGWECALTERNEDASSHLPRAKLPPKSIFYSESPTFLCKGSFCGLYPKCRVKSAYCRECLGVGLSAFEIVERDKIVEQTTVSFPRVARRTKSKANVLQLKECFKHMVMTKRGSTWASFTELATVLENALIRPNEAKTLARGYFRQCEVELAGDIPTEAFVHEYVKLQWHYALQTFRAHHEAFGARLHNGSQINIESLQNVLVKLMGPQQAEHEVAILRADLGKTEETHVAWEEAIVWYLQREEDVRVKRKRALMRVEASV